MEDKDTAFEQRLTFDPNHNSYCLHAASDGSANYYVGINNAAFGTRNTINPVHFDVCNKSKVLASSSYLETQGDTGALDTRQFSEAIKVHNLAQPRTTSLPFTPSGNPILSTFRQVPSPPGKSNSLPLCLMPLPPPLSLMPLPPPNLAPPTPHPTASSLGKHLQCPYCDSDMYFSNNTPMIHHIKSFHKIGEPKAACTLKADPLLGTYNCFCGYITFIKSSYERHEHQHQMGETMAKVPLSCKICGKNFKEAAELENHIKTHKKDGLYCCDMCDLVTFGIAKVILHRRSHTGEKPFACQACSFRTARRDNLRVHYRQIHKTEAFMPRIRKKKVFREIVGAKTLKEKPFKCGVCCYQSARQNSVRAHFKNLHQRDSFICHCGFRTCFKRTYDKHVQHHKMFKVLNKQMHSKTD